MILSRRFLLNSLLANAISPMALPALASVPENNLSKTDWDLIIVGCGVSGLAASVFATGSGVSNILIVEKQPIIGGASILCEGVWSLAGTDFQKQLGYDDSPEKFFANLMEVSKNQAKPELVKAYVNNCLVVYKWLESRGVKPSEIILNTGMDVPRGHTFNPLEVLRTFLKEARNRGVSIKTNTKAESLIVNDHGEVTGITVKKGNELIDLYSKRGIILCSGGFSRNDEWMERYAPKMKNAIRLSAPGAQGDGLIMAVKLGAILADMNNIRAAYGFILNPSSVFDNCQINYAGAISVNSSGLRYVDESLPYKEIGDVALAQEDQKTFLVFDDEILKIQTNLRKSDRDLFSPLQRGEVPTFLYMGQDIVSVARQARIPEGNLLETIDRYNRFVDKGFDEDFGRRYLTPGYGKMRKIQKPPFYIMPTTSAMMGTNCGILIDAHTRVLVPGGSHIPGLYAAGEIVGGFHGNSFVGGTSYGKAMVFGRLAGLEAAK